MDSKKLIEAARDGNVEILQNLIQENPSFLDDIAFVSLSESLLHIATKAGKVNFVMEIMKCNYKLDRELNADGFRPLDIAAIMGNIEIVKVLVRADPEICLLKGKERKTALHYAASKGRFKVIDELASICQDSLKDTTVHGETALHLAVKSYQFDAFQALVKWLEIHQMQEIINWGDHNGNTVLHLAASTKQHECLELLLRKSNIREMVNLNAKNANGLTVMDVLDIVMENSNDLHTREILQQAGAVKTQAAAAAAASNNASQNSRPQAQNQHNVVDHHHLQSSLDWIKYFKFQAQRDSPSDVRNVLLIVSALITTVTFHAGLSPPPAILSNTFTLIMFLFFNTLGLSASISIMLYLTGGFPFQKELIISVASMMAAYGFSVGSTPSEDRTTAFFQIGMFLIQMSFFLPMLLASLPNYLKKAWERGSSRGSFLPIRS